MGFDLKLAVLYLKPKNLKGVRLKKFKYRKKVLLKQNNKVLDHKNILKNMFLQLKIIEIEKGVR